MKYYSVRLADEVVEGVTFYTAQLRTYASEEGYQTEFLVKSQDERVVNATCELWNMCGRHIAPMLHAVTPVAPAGQEDQL